MTGIIIMGCNFLLIVCGSVIVDANILNYFTNANGDGLNIVWAHATNSRALLAHALNPNCGVMMIEADLVLRCGTNEPIMAHPPETDSDLTFREWVMAINATSLGMKLDCKSLDAALLAMQYLVDIHDTLHAPFWLNADILPGPNALKPPVPAKEFIATCINAMPEATLSLGWTTDFRVGLSDFYTWNMLLDMLQLTFDVRQAVTYPVRSSFMLKSWEKLLWLIGMRQDFSLTIWGSANDPMTDVSGILAARINAATDKVFYDLPDIQLNLLKRSIAEGQMLNPIHQRKVHFVPNLWLPVHPDSVQGAFSRTLIGNRGVGFLGEPGGLVLYQNVLDKRLSLSMVVQFQYVHRTQNQSSSSSIVQVCLDAFCVYVFDSGKICESMYENSPHCCTLETTSPAECYEVSLSVINSRFEHAVLRTWRCEDDRGANTSNQCIIQTGSHGVATLVGKMGNSHTDIIVQDLYITTDIEQKSLQLGIQVHAGTTAAAGISLSSTSQLNLL